MSGSTGRFRLLSYFTITSLVAFGIVAAALYFLERAEKTFFIDVQQEQGAFFAQAQADLVREQRATARANLLREHEQGHVTLTQVAANGLWEPHFAPLVARAEQLSIDGCRALPRSDAAGRQACFAEIGRRIRALPGFNAVDAAVNAMMRKSAVFKIKVYDLRGLTVYSSELPQIGEDKAENQGWIIAMRGVPASELVHRDRFSAFEGVVENRDLIQSYVPVLGPDGKVTGVFEIYSDVTSLLAHADALSARIGEVAAANQAKVDAVARDNRRKVAANSALHFTILFALMTLLYLALLALVRRGQRIIDAQERAREQAALREQQMHHEKMAALATMAANASHEIGNPLAVISGLAEELDEARRTGGPIGDQPRVILEQASRIAEMSRRLTEFANARSETSEPVDVNQMVRAVGDFLSYDARYHATRIQVELAEELPACVAIPDHLNEVLMTLLQAHAEASMAATGARMVVRTEVRGEEVVIRIGCESVASAEECALPPGDSRFESVRRRIEGMGGRFVTSGAVSQVYLRCLAPEAVAA